VAIFNIAAKRHPGEIDSVFHWAGKIRKNNDLHIDELVKSRKTLFFVIPAKAVIQSFQLVTEFLDSGFHRSGDFLRNHQG
jgi:uncharacterized protein involved in tolerance to divalent cations